MMSVLLRGRSGLRKAHADNFIAHAAEYGVTVGSDRLEFPEDTVVIATATRDALALADPPTCKRQSARCPKHHRRLF